MSTGKRYYWMKLKESFMTSDTIDYFMSQPDGANYVVLYQMLCLKTINTDGRLSRQIGEIIIPFDVEKIQRDCKWFSVDTIRVALNLYRQVGLVYEDVDGTLVLTDHENLVGSETDAAARMRSSRANRNAALPPPATGGEQSANIVTPDIENRDKSLDIRDQILETDVESSSDEDDSCDSELTHRSSQRQKVMDAWNTLAAYGIPAIRSIADGTQRADWLRSRLNQYGLKAVLEAVVRVTQSDFLMGRNQKGWVITFDWFIRPNNFPKVYEGNYDTRPVETNSPQGATSGADRLREMIARGGFR